MLIGIDMLAVQSAGSDSTESGRLGRQLVSSLLALDPSNRYLLYTHEGLDTEQIPSARRALRVSIEASSDEPMSRRQELQRVLDLNPDGLDWFILLDPFGEHYGGIPLESPLNQLKIASVVTDLSPTRANDRRLAPLLDHDAVLAFTRSSVRECRERLPEISDRVRLLDLAVNASAKGSSRFEPLFPSQAHELGRLGITGPFLLANVASGTERSNLRGILEAYHRLPIEHRSGYQLVITGVVNRPWSAVACLHEHGCADGLVLTGPVDESTLLSLYSRCSVFVSPSFGQASELSLVEAMSRGAAIVAGRGGAQPEILGDAGLLTDPNDTVEIARQIVRLLEDPNLARDLQGKALDHSNRFSWKSVVERFLVIFQNEEPETSSRRYRFDRAHQVRPRIAIFSVSRPVQRCHDDFDAQIAWTCQADSEIDLYFETADLSAAEISHPEFGRFDVRQFARNDNLLGYQAIVHVLPDVFAIRPKLARLEVCPGLVILRDETSIDRIGLDRFRSDPGELDIEAEVARQRLSELFRTGSSIGVRSSRNREAIQKSFPAYNEQVIEIPPLLDSPVSRESRRPVSASRPMAAWLGERSVVSQASRKPRSWIKTDPFDGPIDSNDPYLKTR